MRSLSQSCAHPQRERQLPGILSVVHELHTNTFLSFPAQVTWEGDTRPDCLQKIFNEPSGTKYLELDLEPLMCVVADLVAGEHQLSVVITVKIAPEFQGS